MKKRLLSLILTVSMVFSMLPVATVISAVDVITLNDIEIAFNESGNQITVKTLKALPANLPLAFEGELKTSNGVTVTKPEASLALSGQTASIYNKDRGIYKFIAALTEPLAAGTVLFTIDVTGKGLVKLSSWGDDSLFDADYQLFEFDKVVRNVKKTEVSVSFNETTSCIEVKNVEAIPEKLPLAFAGDIQLVSDITIGSPKLGLISNATGGGFYNPDIDDLDNDDNWYFALLSTSAIPANTVLFSFEVAGTGGIKIVSNASNTETVEGDLVAFSEVINRFPATPPAPEVEVAFNEAGTRIEIKLLEDVAPYTGLTMQGLLQFYEGSIDPENPIKIYTPASSAAISLGFYASAEQRWFLLIVTDTALSAGSVIGYLPVTGKGMLKLTSVASGDVPNAAEIVFDQDLSNLGSVHQHTFGTEWKSDATGHWHECDCGEKDSVLGHNYDENNWVVDVEPGETTSGSKHNNCTVCAFRIDEIIPPTGSGHEHNYATEWTSDKTGHWYACSCDVKKDFALHTESDWIVDIEPDDTNGGSKHTECTICGFTMDTADIDPIGHTHNLATAWTSNDEGHWHTCSGCNLKVDFAEHTEGTWHTEKEPTQNEDGIKYNNCTVCNHKTTGSIPMLSHVHNWGTAWEKNATEHWHVCDGCEEKGSAAAHTAGDWITDKQATETEEGLKHKECTVCTYVTEAAVIPVTEPGHEHVYGADWKGDITGHWNECSCGDKSAVTTHTLDWFTTKAATETEDGEQVNKCLVCGFITETKSIPATGQGHVHSFGTDWKKNATEHWHECACGESSDLAAHTESDWIIDVEATETEDGSKHKLCTVCGYTVATEVITKHTHSFGTEWLKDATGHWHICTAAGCGTKDSVLAHTPGNWIVDSQPTQTAEGSQHKQCTACDYITETETIPPLTGGECTICVNIICLTCGGCRQCRKDTLYTNCGCTECPKTPSKVCGCYVLGDLNNNGKPQVDDAVQILMNLAKNPTSLVATDPKARKASLINAPTASAPTVADAVQILMYLAKNPTSIVNGTIAGAGRADNVTSK